MDLGQLASFLLGLFDDPTEQHMGDSSAQGGLFEA